MKVRKFEEKDIDQVAELFYETVHTVNAEHYDEEQRNAWAPKPTPENKKKLCDSLLAGFSYVVEEGGLTLGFGGMSKEGNLNHLFTHKDYQGQGVASLIGIQLLEDANRTGLTELTTQASETAKAAAEKRGFTVVNVQDKMHNGVVFRNYLMKKAL